MKNQIKQKCVDRLLVGVSIHVERCHVNNTISALTEPYQQRIMYDKPLFFITWPWERFHSLYLTNKDLLISRLTLVGPSIQSF